MKLFPAFLLFTGTVMALNDAPPEMENSTLPDTLPPLESSTVQTAQNLDVIFSGNATFNTDALKEAIARQLKTIQEYGLDEAGAYDAAFYVESHYRKQGFAQVVATPTITGGRSLRIAVREGPLTRIGNVRLEGNRAFDEATLLDYVLGPVRERFPRIDEETELPFVETDIRSGVGLVRRLYASSGYLDAVIEGPMITFNAQRTEAFVKLQIAEGIQYRFGRVHLEGDLIFSPEILLALIAEKSGDIYTDGRLSCAMRAVKDYYVKRGYFQADVTVNGDVEEARNGEVPVLFRINPGALFYFDGITVEGTEGVKPSFLQQRLMHLSGKIYDPALVDESFADLIQTGLFRDLRITPEAWDNNLVRLDVVVEETRPKEFGFGLGYGNFAGAIASISYRDLNFMRNGRPVRFELEASQRGFSGEAVYKDPWLFESDYQLELRLYALTSELEGYAKNEGGFQTILSRELSKHWKVSTTATARHVNVHKVELVPREVAGLTKYNVFSLGLSQTLDHRNNPVLPTRGTIFTTSVDFAPPGMGDISYVKGQVRFSYYLPVTKRSSLAFGARAGGVASLDAGLNPSPKDGESQGAVHFAIGVAF